LAKYLAGECLTCGATRHKYDLKFFGLINWAFGLQEVPLEEMDARRIAITNFHRVVTPRACLQCYLLKAGMLKGTARKEQRQKRRVWLLAGKEATKWAPTPARLKKIERNKEKYRRELAKRRAKRKRPKV
jgi:hypothetical protein